MEAGLEIGRVEVFCESFLSARKRKKKRKEKGKPLTGSPIQEGIKHNSLPSTSIFPIPARTYSCPINLTHCCFSSPWDFLQRMKPLISVSLFSVSVSFLPLPSYSLDCSNTYLLLHILHAVSGLTCYPLSGKTSSFFFG